jgi:hypothetical protein
MQNGNHVITVIKQDSQGTEKIRYHGELVERLPTGIVILAEWTLPTKELGYARFEPGDTFTEYYYSDRWYNIFAILDADGKCKGWYCNVAQPATIFAEHIEQIDLLLDVWVNPDGEPLVLDEDEFAAATLNEEQRTGACEGLRKLLELLETRSEAFSLLGL